MYGAFIWQSLHGIVRWGKLALKLGTRRKFNMLTNKNSISNYYWQVIYIERESWAINI